jgi:thioredoxin-related protein
MVNGRRTLQLLLLLTAIAGALGSGAAAAERGTLTGGIKHAPPEWFKLSFLDIASDVEESAESGRHVLLYLQMDECPYCATMLQESFVDSDYVDFIRENFDSIELDIKGDRQVAMNEQVSLPEKELAQLLGVRYTPTVIFLDARGEPVLRLNGYRSATGFKHALDYVQTRAYETTNLSDFIRAKSGDSVYRFRDDELLSAVDSFQDTGPRPLALLFEDRNCDECNRFHDALMTDPEVRELFAQFLLVRLDADSNAPIVDIQGHRTTPREWAQALGLSYRPGLVLFAQGKEIARIDGMLKTFHFSQVLRYVAERQYLHYPKLRDYARANQEQLLEAGIDIDLWR